MTPPQALAASRSNTEQAFEESRPSPPASQPGQGGGEPAEAPRFHATRMDSVAAFIDRCKTLQTPATLPFLHAHWLQAWYATLGQAEGRRPLPVLVQRVDAQGRAHDAALLPLVHVRRRGLVRIEFADAGVVDYCLPLLATDWLGRAAPEAAAAAFWQALSSLLSGPLVRADVLDIDKLLALEMPEATSARGTAQLPGPVVPPRANPLTLALPSRRSEMTGHHFTTTGHWEERLRQLDSAVRLDLQRCWRLFKRSPGARFVQFTEPGAARALFGHLEQLQSQRMHQLGAHYRLDEPAYRAFYQALLADEGASGLLRLSALYDGDTLVAAALGVANQHRYISLRTALGAAAWRPVSPGRLLDDAIAQHMDAQGWRHFDLGIGTYPHKAKLAAQSIELRQVCVALSWRGRPAQWWWRVRPAVRAWLERHEGLKRSVQRLRGLRSLLSPGRSSPPGH